MARVVAPLLVLALLLAGCTDEAARTVPREPERPAQLPVTVERDVTVDEPAVPSTATRNTIRIGGPDAATDAAGVARALYPGSESRDRPKALTLVDQDDWVTGIAAAVLAGPPVGAPLLLSDGDSLPPATEEALTRLEPRGSELSEGAQLIRLGRDVARPDGYRTAVVEGESAFHRAAAIDRFVSAARGAPSRAVVLYSAEGPAWAMPAAAWAARSGDAALPVRADAIPAPVRRALAEHERPDVYVLGPERVISTGVVEQLKQEKLARSVRRIAGPTPVESAVAFARYRRRDFGWGIVVPGFNFTVASTSRPLDAAAAAPLATRGVFAPLLVTERADELPRALENYFLSVQPGYEDDPGEAVYNRVWILGDEEAISAAQQTAIDRITELVPVRADGP